MYFRVTDSATNATLASGIERNRQRLAEAQEQLSSGKRINRPSDDPAGAGAILRIRTSQEISEQFRRSVATVKDRLSIADGALDSYERWLDRARALLAQGATDTTDSTNRASIANEIDGLRAEILSAANMRSNEQYVFGGTGQTAPPFDPTTYAPAAAATSAQLVQLEPGTPPVAVGVTADKIFADANGTIFQTLTDVSAALRGTGNAAADKAVITAGLDRLGEFNDLASSARINIGVGINTADAAEERLSAVSLAYGATADRIEGTDFVATALALTDSQNALNATLQAAANTGRRSLIDYLG